MSNPRPGFAITGGGIPAQEVGGGKAARGEKHGADKQLILTECKLADEQLDESAGGPTIN